MSSLRPSRSWPAPKRFGSRIALVLPVFGLVALGCGDETESPVAPDQPAELAAAASTPLTFRQVSAGSEHTCGVTSDNLAYCWGHNISGQLGNGTTADHATPVAVAGGLHFVHVSAGVGYTCGVTPDNLVYCWGENSLGQLGDGTTAGRRVPTLVAGGLHFSRVYAGYFHACALTPFDAAFCWGTNTYGQLGDNTTTRRLAPVRVKTGGVLLHELSAGARHTCGTTADFHAYCWGDNNEGQLGTGTLVRKLTPVAVAGGHAFAHVMAAGIGRSGWHSMSCGIATDARTYCWGENTYGQLGDGTKLLRKAPAAVGGNLFFAQIVSNGISTCGLSKAKTVYCWGNNVSGQLGDGTFSDHSLPKPVKGSLSFRQLSVGMLQTCAVNTSDLAYCWGSNTFGEIGDGTKTTRPSPVAVLGPM